MSFAADRQNTANGYRPRILLRFCQGVKIAAQAASKKPSGLEL